MILMYLVTILHVLVCLFLIGVVLLQQGKSADLSVFGGQGSQAAFGPRGTANLLTRLTTWSAVIFMFTSISLFVLIARHAGPRSVLQGIKPAPQSQTTKPAK